MKRIVFILAFMAFSSVNATNLSDDFIIEQERNYCDKPESIKEFDDALKAVPESKLIITLYALRVGLCQMIKDKKISFI